MSPEPKATTSSPPATGELPPRTTASLLLSPLSALYGLGARWRARRWRGRAQRLPHPVLSVGNLTFGGTGKTPFVIHVCRELMARGKRPVILSRGYRAAGPEGNDEAQVIARWLPDVRHVQNPNRFEGGSSVATEADVFVLDDGFQHLPLHRDADVLLVDATDPFGGGACPPGGRLREPLSALARATLVVLTRADQVDRERIGAIMRAVRGRTPAPIATAAFRPSCAVDLTGVDVFVACGIGNPRAFVRTVTSLGANVADRRFFRDHHAYTAADAAALAACGLPVVVTEKDAVKLEPLWAGPAPLHVVRIEFEALDGGAEIDRVLDRL